MKDPIAPDRRPEIPPAPSAEPPRGRRAALVVGLALSVALVVGVATFAAVGGGDAGGERTSLSLAFAEGTTTSYRIAMSMDGAIDLAEMGNQPMDLEVTETVSWMVRSADEDGIATIDVTIGDVSGSVNGVDVPSGDVEQTVTLRVTPGGEILSTTGMTVGAARGTGFGGFPGMDQVTPILPDRDVAPGDSWDKTFSQRFPFGNGTIEYTSHSTFDRYEEVDGVRAAVISSAFEVPIDFSLDLGELAEAFGGAQTPASAGAGDVRISYGGGGDFTQRAWIDLEAREVLRSRSDGSFRLTLEMRGMPDSADGLPSGTISFDGTFELSMERV